MRYATGARRHSPGGHGCTEMSLGLQVLQQGSTAYAGGLGGGIKRAVAEERIGKTSAPVSYAGVRSFYKHRSQCAGRWAG